MEPDLSEYTLLSSEHLLNRYMEGLNRIQPYVTQLNQDQIDRTFVPETGAGQWSCRTLLGHLTDAEIAFSHRIRRIIAEEKPLFSIWDENLFIDRGIYSVGNPEEYIIIISSLRHLTGKLLQTINQSDFSKVGIHPQKGEQSIHTILSFATWHLEHHAVFLDRKLDLITKAAS